MGSGRYTAFLSYSHRDAGQARWLHRRLEAYRVPRRLVGTEGERGPVPARLAPIFRDREELPAAGDLSETVRAALAVSDHLIVVCSPNSAASPWVAKEIAAFRELHPGRPILAAIVEGEPGQCFPAGLAEGSEPLAADLRPGHDGRRLGFLKLVAGLAGVGLDALVQRDAARRVRRVTYVTAGAVAAMLMMAIMTTLALTARAEAQRQRAEAEGLVEFMLTDHRDKLQAVGRLDIMSAVNARALEYYGNRHDLRQLPQASLARRARILHAIGDDNLARHDLTAARAAYEEAAKTTGEQVSRAPGDAQRLIEHAKSLYGIGRVHELRDDWARARSSYEAFAEASDRLLELSPDDPSHMAKAGSAAVDLGNVDFSGTEDYAAAERSYRKAVALFERAAAAKPEDPHIQLNLANALGWLADSFYMRDMWGASLAARRRQYAIVDELRRAHPRNAEISFRHVAARRGLAHSLAKAGSPVEARSQFIEAYASGRCLAWADPQNAEWRALHGKLVRDLQRLGLPGPRAGAVKLIPEEADACRVRDADRKDGLAVAN